MEILGSLDTAKRTVDEIGAEKILAKAGGGSDPIQAAEFIKGRLKVSQLPKSSVIVIDLRHPDPDMVQPILTQVIEQYLKKHQEVHEGSSTVNDFLRRETDRLKGELSETEAELRKTKAGAGVVSTEDPKRPFRIRSRERASRSGMRRLNWRIVRRPIMLYQFFLRQIAPATGTNVSPEIKPQPEVPETVVQEYSQINKRLVNLLTKDEELRGKFSAENSWVVLNRAEIDKAEAEKQQLEQKNPGLKTANSQNLISKLPSQPDQRQPQTDTGVNLAIEGVKIAGLTSRIALLNQI